MAYPAPYRQALIWLEPVWFSSSGQGGVHLDLSFLLPSTWYLNLQSVPNKCSFGGGPFISLGEGRGKHQVLQKSSELVQIEPESPSHVWLFRSPYPPGCLSMGFFRQEYWSGWSGLPFPSPGNLPHPGIEPASLMSPALQADSLPLSQREIGALY